MDNLADIYTRIQLRTNCEIIVTYYSCGKKYIKNLTLGGIVRKFETLVATDSDDLFVFIDFFGDNTMIESIKIPGMAVPVYYNSYVNENIFNGDLIDKKKLEEIKDKMLGDKELDLVKLDCIVERYLDKCNVIKYDDLFFSEKQKEEFELFFNLLVDELSWYAGTHGLDGNLKFICAGTTSLIYSIGDKIIKIGKPRRCSFIPYCEYLLQPIINCDLFFDGYPIHVEVTEKVYALENKDGCAIHSDNEQFREITGELRKILYTRGLSTKDLHPGNVGILLKDNKIHYDEIGFDIGCEKATSIESNNNLMILRTGRFVIIDLDCLMIQDMNKYVKFLRMIGYDEDKITELRTNSKCMVRKK